MKVKTALILCAGLGNRLKPITLEKPKPLLEINNLTLLENTINLIKNNTDKNNILLSCYDGKGVSPLVVSLYIIKNSSITKETVRQLIQTKCKDISLDYELSVFDI